MSQEKVDAKKASKANRKQEVEAARKAKKVKTLVWRIVGLAAAAALAAALIITGVNMYKSYANSRPNYDPDTYVLADYVGAEVAEEATEAE